LATEKSTSEGNANQKAATPNIGRAGDALKGRKRVKSSPIIFKGGKVSTRIQKTAWDGGTWCCLGKGYTKGPKYILQKT